MRDRFLRGWLWGQLTGLMIGIFVTQWYWDVGVFAQ